ncbi:hypothetical protein HYI18_02940 [Clostridium botulinum]|uniref:ABC-three component system middle component 2 n=1 Tax=Clostridium botulinum TaxID=1491 RepID=UPI00174E5E9C|nr:ABC-three component system middle component 2 [Clostridium botulinum]MBD5637573.1 hypothetical protein [Clostridium botulinum]
MNNLFNTPFEISMRVLLTLLTSGRESMTLDMVAVSDFLTIYSRDFDISDYNLHGDNSFSFSEFTSKRKITKEAIKLLVKNNLIDVLRCDEGFKYLLNDRGRQVCNNFTSDYAAEYIALAHDVRDFINGKKEIELMNTINKEATSTQERGFIHG